MPDEVLEPTRAELYAIYAIALSVNCESRIDFFSAPRLEFDKRINICMS